MAGKIKRSTIDTIFETTQIEEVIGDFVQLKKAGSNYKALSPFTDEKTPSFVVSPAKQIFKCFSSGKGGNAVTFLMELEHMTYPEALRYLAKKYSIPIEEEVSDSPEEKRILNERQNLEVVNKFAVDFFTHQLHQTDEGKAIGLAYFKERGFTLDTIKAFELGYSPEKSDALYTAGKEARYSLDYLEKGGLIKRSGERYYDFFRGRVIFPIHNITGKPIAFGGRILKNNTKSAKYFNSPETALYNKSKVLYGMFQARNAVVKANRCYLVEGYTDVISLHQAGVTNTVASSGTALTSDQVKLIKRYTQNITILYDGDSAGIKASFRGIDIILAEGLNVKVVLFPEGSDPDTYARSVDSDTLQTFLTEQADDFMVFKTKILSEEAGNDPVKKAAMVKEILTSISLISDTILRSFYLRECATILFVEEAVLINELNKLLRRKREKEVGHRIPQPLEVPVERQDLKKAVFDTHLIESEVLTKLLQYGQQAIQIELLDEADEKKEVETTVSDYIILEIENDIFDFQNEGYRFLFEQYKAVDVENTPAVQGYFLNHPDEKIRSLTTNILISPYELSANWKEKHHILTEMEDQTPTLLKNNVERTIFAFKLRNVEMLILEKQELLKEQYNTNQKYDELLNEIEQLNQAKALFSKKLTRIILK